MLIDTWAHAKMYSINYNVISFKFKIKILSGTASGIFIFSTAVYIHVKKQLWKSAFIACKTWSV